jgi:hypothetical protein
MKELKSANQLYKESGSSLPFKEWIAREKDKGTFMYANGLQSKINEVIASNVNESFSEGQTNEELPKNTILGLNKYLVISVGVLLVAAVGVAIYKRKK